jgi:hypothetical protein
MRPCRLLVSATKIEAQAVSPHFMDNGLLSYFIIRKLIYRIPL